MRRMAIFCAVIGVIASGVGCKVVTGQHDCTYDPASMNLPPTDGGGKPPYATVGTTVSGVGVPAAASPGLADAPPLPKGPGK